MAKTIDLTGMTILLVEDDELIRDDLDYNLTSLGARTVCTGRLIEAMDMAEGPLTHAVLDVKLQDGNVHPVAARLSERGVPFTFYSASARCDGLADRFPDAVVVSKPAMTERLAAVIAAPIHGEGS